ncbi:ATP-dependent DNA helicase RecG [Candidatus Gracilibacteria bacterium]|nr:MAG: ATP-dependent DNA helicase RecG [Candidatus Gracilibacteria bacterium]PIE84910.1 MAG: ATP-dependent DNA helicase RecG [Candidatus Gracilibacteria bacterium]
MLNRKLDKQILRTTDNYINALEKAGIKCVFDLLKQFPREYEDRTNVLDTFSLINIKEKNTILVKLVSINTQKTSNNKILSKAIIEDKSGFLAEAVWFNRKFLATQLSKFVNSKILITGKVKYAFGKVVFQSPEVETDLSKVSGEIVAIYSDINYIPSKWTNGKISLIKEYISNIKETLPESIIKKYDFISKKEAFYKIHFPKNKHDIEIAKYRLAYDELYEINYKSIREKYDGYNFSEGKSQSIKLDSDLVKSILKKLEFKLTDGQKIALFQILKDMEKNHCMSRLLEGDVGTGKTIIAFIAGVYSILKSTSYSKKEDSIQVAVMAPTEILARQHFEGMQNFLMDFGMSSCLLVGSLTARQKKLIKEDIKNGKIDFIIGTHALVQEDVLFKNLGFVIIDEQHRFGVKQREFLEKGILNSSGILPHVLNMTATPIPRTLALTLYGDQDLSVISEYPKGRKEIYTKVSKNENQRKQIELFIRNELEKGRQVFWISPLVEESEKIDLANAINTYESLVDIFSPFSVGLLHGKMKAKEKQSIMKDFSDNKIQILSSTSVVEVGIDIPNASIICIEGAERFGLSQLHQFRGRVGRGSYQSYCYLFPSKGNSTERLKAMERTNNGFELSEIDLELRGPGEVYGVKQSGVPDLKIAEITDLQLISQIREDIVELFEKK